MGDVLWGDAASFAAVQRAAAFCRPRYELLASDEGPSRSPRARYGTYPLIVGAFVFNSMMVCVGVQTRLNDCPHNLDGILRWFGIMGFVLGLFFHFDRTRGKAAIGTTVILAAFAFVGFLWAWSDMVQNHKDLCGEFLVDWSQFVWTAIICSAVSFIVLLVGQQFRYLSCIDMEVRKLRKHR